MVVLIGTAEVGICGTALLNGDIGLGGTGAAAGTKTGLRDLTTFADSIFVSFFKLLKAKARSACLSGVANRFSSSSVEQSPAPTKVHVTFARGAE